MTQKLEQQVQEVHVTNTNVKKGKGAYMLGMGISVLGMCVPLIQCATETASKVNLNTKTPFDNLTTAWIVGGAIIGVGCVSVLYGRIKHWYYNDRL